MFICVITGFSSGMPLFVLINLLPNWFRISGLDIKTIAFFGLTGLPYSWKFLWSPILDLVGFGKLGRRRGWIVLTQILLVIAIAAFGFCNPLSDLKIITFLAALTAFCSASADIAFDAYRREILLDKELGMGTAIHINAYRISQLIPGSLSLILSSYLPWQSVFLITAAFLIPSALLALFYFPEPELVKGTPKTLKETVIEPFREFFFRLDIKYALMVLAFMFLYKFGDGLATSLQSVFVVDMGYSQTHIALVVKAAMLWATLTGALVGGVVMLKIGINRALWIFGFFQLITIPAYAWLASYGRFATIGSFELWALGLVISAEYFASGLGTAAFTSFIAKLCNPKYTATQFALFSSLTALPRTFFSAGTGWVVEKVGYESFFYICFFLALPAMFILPFIAPWREK